MANYRLIMPLIGCINQIAGMQRRPVYESAYYGARNAFGNSTQWSRRAPSGGLSAGALPLLGLHEFIQQETGQARLIVTQDFIVMQKIAGNVTNSHPLKFGKRRLDWLGALSSIPSQERRPDRLPIDDDKIKNVAPGVIVNGPDVIGNGIVLGFAGLGHQIRDVNAGGARSGDGVHNFFNQQIRNDAGVERAGANQDQIGFADGLQDFGNGAHAPRNQPKTADGFFGPRNIGVAGDDGAVDEFGLERDVLSGGRINPAANGEDQGGDANGFGKVSGDVGESGQK